MNTIETIKNWRYHWLRNLFLFSHIEYQKGLWVDHKYPNEVGWFTEDICKYFDDLMLDDNYEYQIKHNVISLEEFNCIKQFHFELDRFVEKTNEIDLEIIEKELLQNSDWLKTCNMGRNSWLKLKTVIRSIEELKHMDELEKNYLS